MRKVPRSLNWTGGMSERSSVFILSVTPSSNIRTLLGAEIHNSREDQHFGMNANRLVSWWLVARCGLERTGTWNGQISECAQASMLNRHVSFIHVLLQHGEDVRNHSKVQHLHAVAV